MDAFEGEGSRVKLPSETLGRSWNLYVYLPPDYEGSGLEYPVLYLLHGSGGDETSWHTGIEVLDALISVGKVPPAIAVAPSAAYWWVDTVEPFERALIGELIPFVDKTYRTISARGGRAVAGFSMGGYGALRYALAYPDRFAASILLSPAIYSALPPSSSSARTTGAFGTPFDPELWRLLNYPKAVKDYAKKSFEVPTFIAVGDDEWNEPAGWQYNAEYQAVLLFECLCKQMGSAATLRIASGRHDWGLWAPMFSEGLGYIAQFLASPRPAPFEK